jgi:hypothetical protein
MWKIYNNFSSFKEKFGNLSTHQQTMNPEFMSLYQPHSFSFITTFIRRKLHLTMFPLQMVIQQDFQQNRTLDREETSDFHGPT